MAGSQAPTLVIVNQNSNGSHLAIHIFSGFSALRNICTDRRRLHAKVANRPKLNKGYIQLSDRPGVGWESHQDYVTKYRISQQTSEKKG